MSWKALSRAVSAASLLLIGGCGSDDNDHWAIVEVTDHPDPITDNSGDRLFALELVDAGKSFDLEMLYLSIKREDSLFGLELESCLTLTDDQDSDGRYGIGDIITCIEPEPLDIIGTTDIGRAIGVHMTFFVERSEDGGGWGTAWDGEWTAN